MHNYDKMTQEEFDQILTQVVNEYTGEQLLAVPGAYEVFSEEFNNEVLLRWLAGQRGGDNA